MNKIILTTDIDSELERLRALDLAECVRIFYVQELKIDDVHQIITEAFISHDGRKLIILAAQNYNIFAQNALLKVIEEPPSGVEFILLGRNKNAFLPTILSRLLLEDRRKRMQIADFELDLKKMSLDAIYSFLKNSKDISQERAKEQIQSLLFALHQAGILLDDEQLQAFDRALLANSFYQRFEYVFLPLLLMVWQKTKECKKGVACNY